MAYRYWLVLACLGVVFGSNAANIEIKDQTSLKQKVHQAIIKFEQTDRKQWAFQVDRFENEEGDITSSLEQFTPWHDVNKQWSLMRINGNEPTTKQQKKFIKAKRKRANKKQSDKSYSVKFREIINLESLRYQSESATHIEMSFQVTLSQFGDDTKEKLDGLLSYNKQDAFIETITITNNAEFSPMFSAAINEFSLTFNFINIDDAILFREHTLEMKGTFAYFVEIDEVSKDTYSDYQYQTLVE
ncbi:hypothetical protein [Cognaticolwellia mytili]|uniref:hypothetical protein n=1 Tax=Cognaticolwellia mytili TaxID=1888913 RepID=UPI000A16E79D|nr:hypothetical protein [Cognaticolwellia mytili]